MGEGNTYTYDSNTGSNVKVTKIDKFNVCVWDGTSLSEPIKSGDQSHSGSDTQDNQNKDAEICQKIIFNMPESNKIDICNTAGLFWRPLQLPM